MSRLTLSCFAKVNLWLRIVGRRADGYHLLDTCFQTINLADQLVLEPGPPGITMALAGQAGTGLPVPAGDDNLVLRAARLFHQQLGTPPAAHFILHKHIPAGAGLGGGSADAAAALRLLNHGHGQPLDAAALAALAVTLGADVPFMLHGGTMLGSGIGELLTPIEQAPPLRLLLLLPPFGTSTAMVYKNLGLELTMPSDAATVPPVPVSAVRGLAVSESWANDLEVSACQCEPALAGLIHKIRARGFPSAELPPVMLSGSGSTLFLPFPEVPGVEARVAAAAALLSDLAADGVLLREVRTVDAATAGAAPRSSGPWVPDGDGLPHGNRHEVGDKDKQGGRG